jgi:FkbM family methyltransferase
MVHYNFIEIGTCDFATLIQTADDETVGISVEPIEEYLERLPSPAKVKKICAAVSAESGSLPLYYIPDGIRIAFNLPDWMKGCNSLGRKHITVERYLERSGLPVSMIQEQTIPVIALSELIASNDVSSVDYVKIDTEGHDVVIMRELLKLMREGLIVKKIKFESAQLCSKEEVSDIVSQLTELGFSCRQTQRDTYATKE